MASPTRPAHQATGDEDSPEKFDARRVKVGDSDGTGTTDLLYVDGSRMRLWRDQAGNAFAQAVEIPLPALDGQSTTDFVDLLGTGTGCIVWTTSLASAKGRRLGYVELAPAYLERTAATAEAPVDS